MQVPEIPFSKNLLLREGEVHGLPTFGLPNGSICALSSSQIIKEALTLSTATPFSLRNLMISSGCRYWAISTAPLQQRGPRGRSRHFPKDHRIHRGFAAIVIFSL
jgi:hypothetical protein